MRRFSIALILLVVFGLVPQVADAAKAKANRPSDAETYSKALQTARTGRIREIEAMMEAAKRSPRRNAQQRKAATRARAELKRLKSDKPLPHNWGRCLRIEVNAPRIGQVGYLVWGEIDKAEQKEFNVNRIVSAKKVLAQTQWKIIIRDIAKSWDVRLGGTAPSRKIAEHHFSGPMLLFTNVDTAGLRSGAEVKTIDIFVVEGQKDIGGETAFVLRRLEVD